MEVSSTSLVVAEQSNVLDDNTPVAGVISELSIVGSLFSTVTLVVDVVLSPSGSVAVAVQVRRDSVHDCTAV